MAKVVGRDEKVLKRISCRSCAAIVEYAPGEVKNFYSGTDYGGGSDGADGIICPGCGQKIITRSW